MVERSCCVVAIGLIAFFIGSPSWLSLAANSNSSSRSDDGNNNIPEWTPEEEAADDERSRHRHQPSAALLNGILACQSDPCFHGLCIDHTNSSTYSCFCEDGYTGYQCQTNWNECWNAPCHHGGTCVDGIGRYHCLCRPGFTGDDCQVNIDECQSDPCQNGATCQDGDNGYRCRCLPGYEGAFCQVDVSVCRHHHQNASSSSHHETALPPTCRNGARCVEGPGLEFHCQCPEGWTGKHCETDVDECCSNPCKNGGRCIDLIGSYDCACSHGFSGKNCETALERCDDGLCGHQGICWLEGDGQTVCYCRPDYHGIHCEYQYNECLLPGTKCLNGGRCIDQVDGYSCSCPPLWTGPRCQTFSNRTESKEPVDHNRGRPKITTTRKPGGAVTTKKSLTTTSQSPSNTTTTTTMATQSTMAMTTDRQGQTITLQEETTTLSSSTSTTSIPVDSTMSDGDNIGWPTSVNTDTTTTTTSTTTVGEDSEWTTTSILTATPPGDEMAISTTTTTLPEWTTLMTNETTLAQELVTYSTTHLDETTITTVSSVTDAETTTETGAGLTTTTTVKSMSTAATFPSDLFPTTTVIPIPDPRPANKSGNGREREINTVPAEIPGGHGIPSTRTTQPSIFSSSRKSTKPNEILTTTPGTGSSSSGGGGAWSTVDVSAVTRTTDRPPDEDNLVTVTTLGPADMMTTQPTTTTTEIDSYDLPIVTDAGRVVTDPTASTSSVGATPRDRQQPPSTGKPGSQQPTDASTGTSTAKWVGPWEPTLPPGACTGDMCMNGGTCVITPDGWQCRCSWRNEGRRCELERKLRVPQFHGNSYLSYAVPDRTAAAEEDQQQNHQQVLEARLEFSTMNPLGLIAYIHSVDAKVYLAVYTERSTLKFRLSCGQKQMTLVETKYNVSDGAIHVIFVRFLKVEDRNSTSSFCMGSVKLNNSYSMNGEQRLADDEQFSWPARLHIGGRPSGAPTPTELIFLPGMVGCAYSLEIDGQKLDMTKDAVQGKALDECPDRRANCGGTRCLNGGVCSSEDEQRCLCPMGWVGDQCEIRQCPCNPCLGNSTCLMSPADQMICVCTYGRVGTLCEVAVNVTRPQFDGTLMGHSSYLSLEPPPFIRDHFELKFSFVTDDARQVALLLFIGQQVDAEEKDFLAISFIRGHVALTWDLGSGTRRIFTARPVSISTMGGHSVHVGRRGRVAWLQVNNQPTVTGRSPGLQSVLNAHPNLFLGGHSSFNHSQLPSDLPLHSGFRGCIYDLVFRSRDQDFNTHWLPPIQTGRGVRQCSIPSCRLRMRNDTAATSTQWDSSSNGVEDDLNRTSDQMEDDIC